MTTSALPSGNAAPLASVQPRQAPRVSTLSTSNPQIKTHSSSENKGSAHRSARVTREPQHPRDHQSYQRRDTRSDNTEEDGRAATQQKASQQTDVVAKRQADASSQDQEKAQDSAESFVGLLDRELQQQDGDTAGATNVPGQKTGKALAAAKAPAAKRSLTSLYVVPGLAGDPRAALPTTFGAITPLQAQDDDPTGKSDLPSPSQNFASEPMDNSEERQQVVLAAEKAISVRVRSENSQTSDPTPGGPVSVESLLNSQQRALSKADDAGSASPLNGPSAATLLPGHTGSAGDTAPVKAPVRPANSFQIAEVADPPQVTRSAQPMRDISLHLPGAGGVDIRLSERAGQIHVDVRSADPALTQDLRGNIHDLVSGLEKKGFSTDISHPVEQHATQNIDTQSTKNDSHDSQNQDGSAGREQQNQQQQQARFNQFANSKSRKNGERGWNETWTFNTEQKFA